MRYGITWYVCVLIVLSFTDQNKQINILKDLFKYLLQYQYERTCNYTKIEIGMENQYNSNVFFYKTVSNFIPSSVQNGITKIYIDQFI